MKTKLYYLQITLASLTLSAFGQGTFIYDQQSATNLYLPGGVGGTLIQAEQPTGQSFTPTLSSVGFVQMAFSDYPVQNGLGATVYVNLRSDSITGPILGSTDPVFMPDGWNLGITNFFFAAPLAVTPGVTYFFQPVVQSGDPNWEIISGNYGYSGGTFYLNGQPDQAGFDIFFREGVVPEPATWALLILGLGLAAMRKRH